jgi:hypothetical protein
LLDEGIKTMSRFRIERSQGWKVLLGAVGCTVSLGVYLHRASAQSAPDECAAAGKNCSFTISNNSLQKVPALFKLQAQISQAKIPVGDAVFTKLVVNVKSGSTLLCTEPFSQVRVRSGVLNLEIGRAIQGCQLDDVVAKYGDLAFQVCIGDATAEAGNCLKPIQMSSVPYAIKASFATQAQESYRSELAARANYAQRLVADGTRLDQTKLGIGYYDFETPPTAKSDPLKSVNPTFGADVKGAFMQWTPVAAADKTLNISAKNASTGALEPLTKLLFHAGESSVWGKLAVSDTSSFAGFSTFAVGLNVTSGIVTIDAPTTITRLTTIGNSLNVTGTTTTTALTTSGAVNINNGMKVANGINVTSGTVDIQTGANFGSGAGSNTVVFKAGTTVDMSAAFFVPPTAFSVTPKVQTATATGAVGTCVNSAAVSAAKFCVVSAVSQLAVGAGTGCSILNLGAAQSVRACSATCTATCFL